MHDVLLFYTASPDNQHTFHTLYGYEKLAPSTLKTFGTKKQRADFSSGHRKPGVEEEETQGPPLSDTWEVGVIAASGRERTGYPTQKPEALLERVLRASSNEGDLVLDPFCGCGTTLAVAHKLARRFIGIDAAPHAIDICRKRLASAAVEVRGGPPEPAAGPSPLVRSVPG
jgi:site-specific DNA-methyltransferase (adenine-specific)